MRLKDLEKRGIISRKPHPTIPFVLGFISLGLGFWIFNNGLLFYSKILFTLAVSTFIFAFVHLFVVMVLRKN
ncbi:hypothetical protein GOV13_02195 [Candidatus Pacearchaeota archaeon]|nr:hypothetical protein [Candidatus Pacearchaeota archaeon]